MKSGQCSNRLWQRKDGCRNNVIARVLCLKYVRTCLATSDRRQSHGLSVLLCRWDELRQMCGDLLNDASTAKGELTKSHKSQDGQYLSAASTVRSVVSRVLELSDLQGRLTQYSPLHLDFEIEPFNCL